MAELEFRDGKREVADYIAELMTGIKTKRMTYDEALVAMNQKMVGDHIGRSVDRILDAHFQERRR